MSAVAGGPRAGAPGWPFTILSIEDAVDNFLYAVTVHNLHFSIAANARALRRLGSFGSGFCFDGRVVFLLSTAESAGAVADFFAAEFGEVPTVRLVESTTAVS